MKKCFFTGFVVFLLFAGNGIVFSQSDIILPKWAHGFFLETGALYNYAKFAPENAFKIDSHFLLFRIGGGYDFGKITVKLYGDFGINLAGDWYNGNNAGKIFDDLDVSNIKFGIESGIKVLNTEGFDFVIPIGFLFNWTKYTQKNPSYVSGYPYDRIWEYKYYNVITGFDITFKLNNHIKLIFTGSIGYPVFKELEYQEKLQGNYIWTDTGSSTYSIKDNTEVFTFSTGIGLRFNL
jgi:hypothetical protein